MGGMGRVYLARDRRLDRLVALKEASDGAAEAALAREARVTATLEHPGIVAVYDDGLTEDGRPYYTMRLVRGRPLSKIVAETPLLADRLRLLRPFLQACEAMAYAHDRGVLHRDLKPSNIVLGEHGETQVVDWGLAVPVDEVAPGSPVGTPAYMSPEQARGERVDRRADVWGLGAVLCELLTRAPPGERAGVELPPELAAILERALAPVPADRYPDAAALAADVDAWLDGRRVSAYRYSSVELARRLARVWRAPLAVGALALAALLITGIWYTIKLGVERDRALEAEHEAREALARSDHHLAAALVERGRRALEAGSLSEAELLAANALIREDTPEARGLLMGARAEAPARRIAAAEAPGCPNLVALGVDDVICSGGGQIWRVVGGVERWRQARPSSLIWLSAGRLLALAEGEIAAIDVDDGHALDVRWGAVAVGGRPVPLLGAEAAWSQRLAVDACGAAGLAALGTDGGARLGLLCRDGRVGLTLANGESEFKARVERGGFSDVLTLALVGEALIVLGDVRGRVGVVDLRTGQIWTRESAGVDAPRRLVPDAGGERLAVARESGRVELLTLPELEPIATLPARGLRDLRFLEEGDLLVTDALRVSAWRPPTPPRPAVLRASSGLSSVSFSPDGRTLGSTHSWGLVGLWDLSGATPPRLLDIGDATVKAGAFTPDGTGFFTVDVGVPTDDQPLYLPRMWAVPDGEQRWVASESLVRAWAARLEIPSRRPESPGRRVGVLADGVVVVVPYVLGLLGALGDADVALDCPRAIYVDLAVAQGGAFAALIDEAGRVLRLDAATRRCEQVAEGGGLGTVDLSADGRVIVVGGDGELRRLGPDGWTIAHPAPYPQDVALSPDRRWVATAGPDRAARVWDARTGALRAVLPGHAERVVSVDISPDGRLLATGSWDSTARLWDLGALELAVEGLGAAVEERLGVGLEEGLGG